MSGEKRRFGVLSLEWGPFQLCVAEHNERCARSDTLLALLAAVDFESEAIRFIGGARFSIWAVKKVLDGEAHSGIVAWTDQPPMESTAGDFVRLEGIDESLRHGPPLRYLPIHDISRWQGAAGEFGPIFWSGF